MTTTIDATTTRTLEALGAVLTYDVREGPGDSPAPVLFLIGSPMGAGGSAHSPRTSPTARS